MAENIFYVSEKAKEFFQETVDELESIGWQISGDLSIEQATYDGKTYLLRANMTRHVEVGDR